MSELENPDQRGMRKGLLDEQRLLVDRLELYKLQDVKVSGDEPWLKTIYAGFLTVEPKEPAKLTAEFQVERQELVVRLQGGFQFSPLLACSRCVESFSIDLKKSMDLYFSFEAEDLPRDCDLNMTQLDEYVVVNGQIDLEVILNEAIQLEMPNAPKCPACETADLVDGDKEPLVYSSGDVNLETHRPFANLGKITVSKH